MNNCLDFLRSMQYLKKLYNKKSTIICKKYSLTTMEMDILAFLANNPQYDTSKDIVEIRMLAKSHVSSSIDTLTSMGYIKKSTDKNDGRCTHLKLTEKCYEPVKQIQTMQKNFSSDVFDNFTKEEQELFFHYINRICGNVLTALNIKEDYIYNEQ